QKEQELTNSLTTAKNDKRVKEQELAQTKIEFNQQLKQINSLFDPSAQYFTEPISFNGLYKELGKKLTEKSELEKNLTKQLEQINQQNTQLTKQKEVLTTLAQELTNQDQPIQELEELLK
ncbi:9169_t:CDS:1, partial [Ambispora gerdemannii]